MSIAEVFVINGVNVQSYRDEAGVYMMEAVSIVVAMGLEESLAITICNNPFFSNQTFQRVGIKPYLIYGKIGIPKLLTELNYLFYITSEEAARFVEAVKTAKIIKLDAV